MKPKIIVIVCFLCVAMPALPKSTYYILDAPSNGFFSCFHMVTGFLDFYEKNKSDCAGIEINFTRGFYLDPSVGPNWWEYFFEPVKIGSDKNADIVYCPYAQKAQWAWNAISIISRVEASKLITKYIHVKPHVLKKVADFIAKNFQGSSVIGVHYRGTDKNKSEATYVPYKKVYEEIVRVIEKQQYKQYKLFVATDEQAFVTYITKRCKNVVSYDAHRSTNGHSVHGQFRNNYFLGEEALIDCLLLVHCDLIIRTFSNLNSAAANINPNVPVITLNESVVPAIYLDPYHVSNADLR